MLHLLFYSNTSALKSGKEEFTLSFTTSSNTTNSADLTTISAQYDLGGGVSVGATYFDIEQEENSVVATDADGIMTMLSVGF